MRKTIIQVGGAIISAGTMAFSIVSDLYGYAPNIRWQIIALIGFALFSIFIFWIIWDKQNQINKFTCGIYLSVGINPKTYESGQDLIVDIEIWTDKDIHTDNLILNFEAIRGLDMLNTPWWNVPRLWGLTLSYFPFFKKMFHCETEDGEYRKYIKCSDTQPFKDTVSFKTSTVTKHNLKWSNVFLMEVVLVTGIPQAKFRKYLEIPKAKTYEPI